MEEDMRVIDNFKKIFLSLIFEGFPQKEAFEIAYYQIKIEEKEI